MSEDIQDILELIEERALRKFERMKKEYLKKEKVGSNEKYKSGHLSRPVI